MKYTLVKYPKFTSVGLVELVVKFEHLDEEVPFVANPNDCEAHGRELYARAIAGDFGVVQPFQEM